MYPRCTAVVLATLKHRSGALLSEAESGQQLYRDLTEHSQRLRLRRAFGTWRRDRGGVTRNVGADVEGRQKSADRDEAMKRVDA